LAAALILAIAVTAGGVLSRVIVFAFRDVSTWRVVPDVTASVIRFYLVVALRLVSIRSILLAMPTQIFIRAVVR
jgi:hypothetical protein